MGWEKRFARRELGRRIDEMIIRLYATNARSFVFPQISLQLYANPWWLQAAHLHNSTEIVGLTLERANAAGHNGRITGYATGRSQVRFQSDMHPPLKYTMSVPNLLRVFIFYLCIWHAFTVKFNLSFLIFFLFTWQFDMKKRLRLIKYYTAEIFKKFRNLGQVKKAIEL